MKNLSNHFFGAMIFAAILLSLNACNKNDDKPDNTVDFNATLNEAQETPPTGENGTGTCTATYNTETNELSYTLTWDGLTGVPTAMHFHKAAIGVPGDVEIPIPGLQQLQVLHLPPLPLLTKMMSRTYLKENFMLTYILPRIRLEKFGAS